MGLASPEGSETTIRVQPDRGTQLAPFDTFEVSLEDPANGELIRSGKVDELAVAFEEERLARGA